MEFHAFISMDIVLRVESLLVSFFQGINLLCNCKRTIFFYKRSDDFLIHRLGNRRGIQKNNNQAVILLVGRAVIYNKGNVPILGTNILINFFKQFFKQLRSYPTFWFYPIATWNVFHTFKTLESLICQSQTLLVCLHLH